MYTVRGLHIAIHHCVMLALTHSSMYSLSFVCALLQYLLNMTDDWLYSLQVGTPVNLDMRSQLRRLVLEGQRQEESLKVITLLCVNQTGWSYSCLSGRRSAGLVARRRRRQRKLTANQRKNPPLQCMMMKVGTSLYLWRRLWRLKCWYTK